MSLGESQRELLLSFVDRQLHAEEMQQVEQLLRADPATREFLWDVAEQAVMIADLERANQSRQAELQAVAPAGRVVLRESARPFTIRLATLRAWQMALAVLLMAVLAVSAYAYVAAKKPSIAKVSKVTGASHFFGSTGQTETSLSEGILLVAGDSIESRSCDAWITLDLGDQAALTIAGNSSIRVLYSESGETRFDLLHGSLWFSPATHRSGKRLFIQTPTAVLEAQDTLFNIQTSASDTIVRVHEGSVRVTQRLDGKSVELPASHQAIISLNGKASMAVTPQLLPVESWSSRFAQSPDASLGQWLPPTKSLPARLRAVPLLWPIEGRDPLLLHVVGTAAWKSSDQPVLLRPESRLRFRGRTERRQMVRFGFSTQKMRGVFAGKFEVDISPERLGPVGETWEVELPLTEFRPLHPQMASSPDGLELTDVYALTIVEDAGLEIFSMELAPQK